MLSKMPAIIAAGFAIIYSSLQMSALTKPLKETSVCRKGKIGNLNG